MREKLHSRERKKRRRWSVDKHKERARYLSARSRDAPKERPAQTFQLLTDNRGARVPAGGREG